MVSWRCMNVEYSISVLEWLCLNIWGSSGSLRRAYSNPSLVTNQRPRWPCLLNHCRNVEVGLTFRKGNGNICLQSALQHLREPQMCADFIKDPSTPRPRCPADKAQWDHSQALLLSTFKQAGECYVPLVVLPPSERWRLFLKCYILNITNNCFLEECWLIFFTFLLPKYLKTSKQTKYFY